MPLPQPAAQRWTAPSASTWLGATLVVAMSISLAWQTADWLRLLRSPAPVAAHTEPPLSDQAIQGDALALFGAAQPSTAGDLPATHLRLTLLGSFVHNDPAQSSAILQQEGQPAQRYRVNTELVPGVRLAQVHADHVEVLRNGRRERLDFPQRPALTNAPTDTGDTLEQLDQLEADNLETLRERMEALREQMEASGMPSTDSEPVEADPANESSPESE